MPSFVWGGVPLISTGVPAHQDRPSPLRRAKLRKGAMGGLVAVLGCVGGGLFAAPVLLYFPPPFMVSLERGGGLPSMLHRKGG